MATLDNLHQHRMAFGPFEVDASTGELRRRGIRIRLPGQPFQILLLLLARPGEVVTREQLREQIWREGTFVDFEHGLYAAMNRLRHALSDSAEKPRYIETLPGRGYRFIGTVERGENPPIAISETLPLQQGQSASKSGRLWWLALSIGCIGSFASAWFLHSPAGLPSWTITRITSDAGLSSTPAISPDGKLIAYSSDNGPKGGRDLYLKQVTGGPPVRLTFDGADNTTPDFSPDGSRLVFRSSRNGGGIYEIPAFGGEVRFLAHDGRNPRFSPDGSRIAYWVGDDNVASAVPGSGAVWVISAAGGQPERLGANFTAARYPIWSPDSQQLLLVGYTSQKAYESSGIDWWLVTADGHHALRTGAYDAFVHGGLHGYDLAFDSSQNSGSIRPIPDIPRPNCWSAVDDTVMFPARNTRGDTFNIWQTHLSRRTGKLRGTFTRVTAGAGNELEAACASRDAVAFTNEEIKREVWIFPYNLEQAKAGGALERVTEGPALHEYPSLSQDGRHIAFASAQSDHLSIWTRDLATGLELHPANSPFIQRFPVISGSGEKVAFSSYEKGARTVYISTRGGPAEKVCDGCLRATDWSGDEKRLLIFGGNPYQVSVLDVTSHQQTVLFKHGSYHLLYAHFSPDEEWVSFTARTQPNRGRIAIARIDGAKPVPESAWIPIAEGGVEDWAVWSPNGRTLYFMSERDGYACIWGQRLDAKSHEPVGAAFAVQHLHGRLTYQRGGWSAAGGRFAMVLMEDTGNIWMMSRTKAQ